MSLGLEVMQKNQELYEAAFAEYTSRITNLIIDLRVLESRAGALLSLDVADKLNKFQWGVLMQQDLNMLMLHRQTANQDQWQQQHARNLEALGEANQLISAIALDLGIAIAQ